MSKRIFEIFDEMNQNDEVNKTATIGCCYSIVSTNKTKQGGHVTMGVPEDILMDIMSDKKQPILIILDKAEYFRLQKLSEINK